MSDSMTELPDENSKRFIAVLNKKVEPGRLMNALGHMMVGASQEQQDATRSTSEADLEYWGIVLFGSTQELREFTGKFSLYQWRVKMSQVRYE